MKFYIIGIDDHSTQNFNSEISEIINSHSVFSGGIRHHNIVADILPADYRWIDITTPLSEVFLQYTKHKELVVFASGDPLFFGFANTVKKEMPNAEIKLYPYFNSLQLLAHKLLIPYHDIHFVSLTGRPWHKFDEALISGYDKIGVLTDKKEHTPSSIANYMLHFGYNNYQMTVGELLGNKEKEKISVWKLEDAAKTHFECPNNLILTKTDERLRPLGIPDNEFHLLNNRALMITKMPIRLLSLSMLDLRHKKVFWDIGFCTGSVSIEAKLQFPHLEIIAFEKRVEGIELMEKNTQKFGTPGIKSFIDDFLQLDIKQLPKPNAVFIGGHGGRLNEIVKKISDLILPNGTIVFNSVSEESRKLFSESVQHNHLTIQSSISIKIDDFNTIEVMKAIK